MQMRMFPTAIAAAAALSALVAGDARAQTLSPPVQRPMQGLFGRAPNGGGLDMSVFAFEGYDDDQIGIGSGLLDPRTQKSGAFDGLDFAVSLKRKFRHVSFEGGEQSAVRYYPNAQDFVGVRHQGAFGLDGQFDRSRFHVSQTIAYAPYYTYTTLPQLFDAQPADTPLSESQFLTRRPALVTETSGEVSQKFGRMTLSGDARTQRTDFLEETGTGLRADSATARLVYHVSRDVGLVAGYGLQRGLYNFESTTPQAVEFHNLEFGIDYDHALSLTRRTTIGFATGTTAVRDLNGNAEYRLIADARLSREIGRTWHATLSFHRGAGLIAGFGEPFFADAVMGGIVGSLNRRTTLATSAGYSDGELTGPAQGNGTRNYSASARVQYALTRMVALSAEYDYYQYRFDRRDGVPIGLPQALARNSFMGGLTLWLPLVR